MRDEACQQATEPALVYIGYTPGSLLRDRLAPASWSYEQHSLAIRLQLY